MPEPVARVSVVTRFAPFVLVLAAGCAAAVPEAPPPAVPTPTPTPIATEVAQSQPAVPTGSIMGENGAPLPPETVPPRLMDLVLNLDFPREARAKKINEGEVWLRFLVSASGRAEQIEVVKGDEVFERAAVAAIRPRQFRPAKLHGKAVPAFMVLRVEYRR